jgi:alginate O-acetyltransferase complex protein AlgI
VLFNSEAYFLFLPSVVAVTWLLPKRWRPLFLLSASYFFYAYWNVAFLPLIIGLTIGNYLLGHAQVRADGGRQRAAMIGGVAINLGALAVFKYLGLFDQTAARVAGVFGLDPHLPIVQLILPLGLSFFAFEFIHYQVDVWRGSQPIRSVIRFALFPAFFPTQIAGPIKRYQDFDKQVRTQPEFDSVRFLEGLELVARGLFKKTMLADNLLPIAQAVFVHASTATFVDTWTGVLAFSFQIYLDFSGYTDIGRGSAQMLGYTVPINFDAPYLATSIRDFWRRWHISLSSWLRDYLYIPLGGSRTTTWRRSVNLFLTMALGGLWHGAAWHFMVWGSGHGLALVANHNLARPRTWPPWMPPWLPVAVAWAATQLVVLFLWVMFRAANEVDALRLWARMLMPAGGQIYVSHQDVFAVAAIGGGVMLAQIVFRRIDLLKLVRDRPLSLVARPAYVVFLLLAANYGLHVRLAHSFIYFQF